MKDITWLRDYFTDAEILEYKDNILKKYFPIGAENDLAVDIMKLENQKFLEYYDEVITRITSGKGQTQSWSQRRERRCPSETSQRKQTFKKRK